MRVLTAIGFLIITISLQAQQFSLQTTEMALMPEAVSNNAVCEGFVGSTPYVYSFCGIDTSKIYSGIHLKSFRYNTSTDIWETIAEVPDTMGKVAASANRVGDVIYVIGGYHVKANGNEISSKSVHRYDTQSNIWLSDGASIPIAIDDQVQAVYKDSLIYVITGWSNSNNVTSVQIYDTYNDSWQVGTSVPNTSTSRLFGGSGIIIGNTIYYYGGAKNSSFSAGNTLTVGEIDSLDPTIIMWTDTILDSSIKSYRGACTKIWGTAMWIGGSSISYNFNGIAYNGSGGVPPNNQNFWLNNEDMSFGTDSLGLPMDVRGVASTSLFTKYLVGGMEDNQQVSRKTIKIEFTDLTGLFSGYDQNERLKVYPNPSSATISFEFENLMNEEIMFKLYNVNGQLILQNTTTLDSLIINSELLTAGVYFYQFQFRNREPLNGKVVIE
ncbi:MAG: T9SS type A sorting domain-containing protein [Flavobacteriales bacterium]|nr:T9SS type A sorting domain-containing protein [Flavobacteriales bacterium]